MTLVVQITQITPLRLALVTWIVAKQYPPVLEALIPNNFKEDTIMTTVLGIIVWVCLIYGTLDVESRLY